MMKLGAAACVVENVLKGDYPDIDELVEARKACRNAGYAWNVAEAVKFSPEHLVPLLSGTIRKLRGVRPKRLRNA